MSASLPGQPVRSASLPGQVNQPARNETGEGKRGNARKRKTQLEQTGPYEKKQLYQAQLTRSYPATSFKDNDFGFTQEQVMHNPSDKTGHNKMCHKGQNFTTKNKRNMNKQQQKNLHQQKDGWRTANRGGSHRTRPTWGKGGGHSKNKYDKQDIQVEPTRFMSQDFKDQNAVLVDGRLVCRHFLFGRCIKGDDCQLEHIEGYNDLVKEVCKFYIQGVCTKGEGCPYMHMSFPCKYFHSKGKCYQGADCRFSHEPLNDVTNRLLCEALKREHDLCELRKKAEQKASGQPEDTEESEIIEANRTPDTLLQSLRPIFYNSEEINAEKETLVCQTDDLADVMEEAVPPQASDAVRPHIPPSSNLNYEEPICYSVAAVLGSQLFKPFQSFFTTPGSQESVTSGSTSQSEAPYSVDAVLRSYKSVENSTFGHTPTPPTTQTVSYTPKTDFEEITGPLLSSETQTEKVLYSVNTRNEVNKSQERTIMSLSSLQVHTSLISKTCPSSTLASRDYKKQGGNMPEPLKPAQRAAHEVKLELLLSPVTEEERSASSKNKGAMKGSMHLPTDITCSVNCKGVIPFGRTNRKSISSRPAGQTSTSRLNTSDSQASMKPCYSSSDFTEFKGGSAVPVDSVTCFMKTSDSANSVSCHLAAKQPTKIHLHSKKTTAGLKCGTHHHSTAVTAECSSKMARCGDLAAGSKKTLKRPFRSLFASPISDALQPIDDSVTDSSCPQGFIQSSCSPQSADYTSNLVKRVIEHDKASARPFLSLFATPLPSIESLEHSRISSCSQHSNQFVKNTSQLSNSKQRASNLEPPLPGQADYKEIPHALRFPNLSGNPKIGNEDNSKEHVNQATKQLVNPVCSLVSDSLSPTPCGNSPSTTHAHQPLPDISSHKGSVVAATANSVLKTLFLSLGPYQEDGEQQDSRSHQCPCRLPVQQSTENIVANSTEHQHALQTPHISVSSPGMTEPQVTNSPGTTNMPCKPVAPLMQHRTRPRQKPTSEEGMCVNGDVVATPFKDLFKTLDTTVFHGH
ncbi:uncharacterized protein LOC141763026 isoform X1 [Sebastes fasciatus]|uniref:uncharacterized protein LOC141763026 isoform X1 n=1 Tax=Sebastes fasciatus TaxID=394691 RepID=UPI003D9EF35E